MFRWTIRRKAAVVEKALENPDQVEALLKEHGISPEELATWCERLIYVGVPGLRATRVQDYRRAA